MYARHTFERDRELSGLANWASSSANRILNFRLKPQFPEEGSPAGLHKLHASDAPEKVVKTAFYG
jgi:hypothetical protein